MSKKVGFIFGVSVMEVPETKMCFLASTMLKFT